MTVHRTIWPSVQAELRVIPSRDGLSQDRVTLYASEGAFSFCFALSPEAARALAADLVAGADALQSPDPILSAHEE